MNPRPIIGVTGPHTGGLAAWWSCRLAIGFCGGRARRITVSSPADIQSIDGLIIGGGADVSPSLYTDEPDENEAVWREFRWKNLVSAIVFAPFFLVLRLLLSTKNPRTIDQMRDTLEKELIQQALARDIPLLGICRGAQLINVVCGGTLLRDISSMYEEVPRLRTILPRKRVQLAGGSKLAACTGTNVLLVNALHDQAIDHAGEEILVCAREESGIVQAIEHSKKTFTIGVQWHPEYLVYRRDQRALFCALVDATRKTIKEKTCKTG
ncbi:gamma-glutamyl-gamma-aminobutyrate hydrolase family protein [Desulfurispirillum indicum]|uniref:gamma-glutamyl-gamma-aminobutyrate hydrolase family protein n=1 Tax=Desulfurispirillum indicum TaxID=936456 RepID=UPI001CFA2B61|nr:gamma-glutamyl-gamma-aminobutyrate hydrolase family protein [Desulfurispirillum indicum]UCZ57885.1 gamma-glutamyl-gamma-aminobutyrate hydrolase family protein [Desulfurispirillum indicum]